MKRLRLLPFLFLTLSTHAQSYTGLIDNTRASAGAGGLGTNGWAQAGVTGGIPSSTWTQCGSTIAAYSGTTDTINNAIAACGTNQYVLLGPGTFNLTSTGTVSPGIRIRINNVVLRGSGADQTFLVMASGAKDGCTGISGAICLQSPTAGNPFSDPTVAWTAGYAQGSNQVTLASTTGVVPGTTGVVLSQCSFGLSGTSCSGPSNEAPDNGNFWDCNQEYTTAWNSSTTYGVNQQVTYATTGHWYIALGTSTNVLPTVTASWSDQGVYANATFGCAVNGPDNGNQQLSRPQSETFVVSAVNAGTGVVTLNGTLKNPNWNSANTPTALIVPLLQNSGVENLSLDTTSDNSLASISMIYTAGCWFKGVRFVKTPSYGVWAIVSSHDTFEQNYFWGTTLTPGADNYAFNLTFGTDDLIQNNIIQNLEGTLVEEGPATGNVFGYNFSIFENNGNNSGLNPAYFPHAGNRYQLFEGNITNAYFGENFHGPKIADTLYRNFFTGWESGANQPTPVVKNSGTTAVRFMHHSRYPNVIGNVLGTPTVSTAGYSTTAGFAVGFIYEVGSNDLAPADPIVASTRYFWGNWDIVSNATRWCGSASDTGWVAVCGSISEVPTGIAVMPQSLPTVGDTGAGQSALPASLYLASKPSWFRNLPFPLIGPDVASGNVGMCSGTIDTAGNYSGVPAETSGQCSPGPALTSAWAGHVNANPAMDCFLSVMGGKPDGTGTSALSFNASTCYSGTTVQPVSAPAKTMFAGNMTSSGVAGN